MSVDALLSRLDAVRQVGAGQWRARCPAHEDKCPSLSVRELPDGRTLVHDFAGCAVEDVLVAVGLTFDALFPERSTDHRVKRVRSPFDTRTAFHALVTEITIIALYAADLRAGLIPDHRDHERFLRACSTITSAQGYCDGK